MTEALHVIGHQDQAALDHQEIRLGVLREKKAVSVIRSEEERGKRNYNSGIGGNILK